MNSGNLNGDQPLPYTEAGEKGVLCSLILEPRLADEIRSQVGTDYLYHPAHKIVYEAVLKLLDTGKAVRTKPIDFNLLASYLKDAGQLEKEIGGKDGLNEIYECVDTASNWRYYAEDIQEKWARRKAIVDYGRQEKAAFDLDAKPDQWDPDGNYLGAMVRRELKGASILNFSQRKIDQSKTLLGNRYLCRYGGLFIVAPSGHGKSTLTVQAAAELACGLLAFGIRPSGPLRSLVIQSEDDEGDTTEMARVVDHLKLTKEQRQLVDRNTHIEFVNDAVGDEFLRLVDGFLRQWRADLLWINPYTAYLGADIKDPGANAHFLRNGLNPLLTKHGCAVVVIHHTPKTNFRDTTTWKPSDWMYSGAGAAELTNWARAYLAIDPCEEPDLYKFIAAKRGKRIGWADENGFPVCEQFYAHSTKEGQLLWLPANRDQVAAAKPKGQKGPDNLLPLIPLIDPISQERLFLAAKPMGENKVRSFLKILIEDGKIKEQPIKREEGASKFAKAAIGYVRRATPDSQPGIVSI